MSAKFSMFEIKTVVADLLPWPDQAVVGSWLPFGKRAAGPR